MLFVAVSLGAVMAVAAPTGEGTAGAGSGSAPVAGSVAGSASASGSVAASASVAGSPSASAVSYAHGVAPLPSGSAVPKAWLPAGAEEPDRGPSLAIYPSQRLTIRMSHKVHAGDMKMACTRCHAASTSSTKASDWLLPTKHEACDACHSIDEREPYKETTPGGRCDFCHLGSTSTLTAGVWTTTVVRLQIPTANMKMSHKAHADAGVKCQQCHGEVQSLELATRDQLPRMKGCFGCHTAGGSAKAKTACTTCHLAEKSGVTLQTMLPSGTLLPPKWLKNASHGADWIERHKRVAGLDSGFCANCHREQECTDCHDGKTRPRSVHPNDWLNMHEVSARMDAPKCASCHSTSGFCVPCHTRVGVANGSPSGVKTTRFHPADWATGKRMPGDHSYEAQKNITACVSCHVERDCATCHASKGVGGGGAKTHGPGFAAKCDVMYAKNPRPCFVCHAPDDADLARCR
jgi:hypothetical protein